MSTDVKNNFYKRDFTKFPLSAVETQVAETWKDIATSTDIDLKDIFLSSVRQYEVTKEQRKLKNAVLIQVPYPCWNALQKVQRKLVVELEKRLRAFVLITPKRTIQSKWIKPHRSQTRPRSRTLTHVFDAILDDFCLPSSIIGKRTRVQTDGKRFVKIYLDESDKLLFGDRGEKLEAITQVYKKLTTREVSIEFRQDVNYYNFKK